MRLFLLFSCLLAWVLAAPIDQEEEAFRFLNNYLQSQQQQQPFLSDDNDIVYVISGHGSNKRGLGPRPLRFG